jgi:hypothetical protein
MTRSIVYAGLVLAMLAACAQNPAPPAPVPNSADNLTSGFVPYCGPVWSVAGQGYRIIPCPDGSNYPGAR